MLQACDETKTIDNELYLWTMALNLLYQSIRSCGVYPTIMWYGFSSVWKKVTSARELLSKQTRVSRIGLNDEADVKNISYRTKTTASPHIIYVRHIMKARIQPINRDYRLTDGPVFHQIYSYRDHVFSVLENNIIHVCVRCELAYRISISPFRNRVFDEFYTKVQKKNIFYATPFAHHEPILFTQPDCDAA